ncbi:MAG: hypothetical protein H6715_00145 [Myxococcales bacterium]|nr:hypothetical protein [Myxococcales bacterium]MCB9707374.1 hypothetical protein [Myxococcales bacterium]
MRVWQIWVLVGMTLGACRVDSNDIQTWKSTVKGPGKIVSVALTPKYDVKLRARALVALVEMNRQDVDGMAEFEQTLRKLTDKDSPQIIHDVAEQLKTLMHGTTKATADESGPAALEVRAKDAAFILVPLASEEVRRDLSTSIVQWLAGDFNGRSLAGKFSAEQIIRALGASAGAQLVAALDPRMPQMALIKLSQLIAQVGDDATKAQAAKRLVEIEREMESKEFLVWLETRILEQAKDRGQTVKRPDVQRAALHHREVFITTGALPAMSSVADQRVVAERLLQIASINSQEPAMVERRWRALAALEGKASADQLDRLLELALNNANPTKVRDYAFDRLSDVRSPKTVARLWPLVQSASNARERWRAGELVLAIGGEKVLSEFLDKLPHQGDVNYEPEELEGYAKRIGQLSPLPTSKLRGMLGSKNWWERVIALRVLERKGTKNDIPSVQKVKTDATPVKGKHWDPNMTVGKVAGEVLQVLTQRASLSPAQ